MTIEQAQKKIGKVGYVKMSYKNMYVEVTVEEAKKERGGIIYKVDPVRGRAKDCWVRDIIWK